MGLTAAVIAVAVLGVAAAGISTYSTLQQAEAQEKAAKFNAGVAENNRLAALQQSQYNAERIRQRNRRVLGRARAIAGKSGAGFTGSFEDVLYDSAVQGELDVLAALYSGQVSATYYGSQAELERFAASTARAQGPLGAAGTALGGLASAGSLAAQTYRRQSPTRRQSDYIGDVNINPSVAFTA